MRSIVVVVVLFFAAKAQAQQSLFNVPSTQETIPGKLFGQVQINATPEGTELNPPMKKRRALLAWRVRRRPL